MVVCLSSINCAPQRLVLASLWTESLRLYHYSLPAEHVGERHIYDMMRHKLYWPDMAYVLQAAVRDAFSYSWSRRTSKRWHRVCLFLLFGALEHMFMSRLIPLPNKISGKQCIVVITGQYSKITEVTQTAWTTPDAAATIFVGHWISNFGILITIINDNVPRFTLKFFQVFCAELCGGPLTTTQYHPQTNRRVEHYNAAIIFRLRHYVTKH